VDRIVIIGAGPAGYEAALVAAQLDADVTIVDPDGAGGACVLSDCVPSKTFIASSDVVTGYRDTEEFGVDAGGLDAVTVDASAVYDRVKRLALAQSADIHANLIKAGVTYVTGTARLGEDTIGHSHRVKITPADDRAPYEIDATAVLIATGATPRLLPDAMPDGERILTWRQIYDLPELPEHLIVVGSGVTGAEFASAYLAMGVPVTLVSSRDRVMPHEDADAATAIERVFRNRGMEILNNSRAAAARRHGDGVEVVLTDGREEKITAGSGRLQLADWLARPARPTQLESEALLKVLFGNMTPLPILLERIAEVGAEAEAVEEPWRSIAREYANGEGLFPERAHINALFWVLLDRWALLRATRSSDHSVKRFRLRPKELLRCRAAAVRSRALPRCGIDR